MITISIAGTDRSSIIEFGSVKKKDVLNQQADTLEFEIIYHPGQTFRPESNAEVTMYDGATKVFGGKIQTIERGIEAGSRVTYKVKCRDYSYDLNRQLVVEGYESETVDDIIADILTNFTDGSFTDTNVDCSITVTKVTFDRITVSASLQKLADLVGYSWYVDYDKDIHFFEKSTELAPFDLTDGDGNFITDSLQVNDDFSQIKNRVFVKGGEIEGNERTETFDGDGSKLTYSLANKFADLPAVVVDSVTQTVGVDFLDNEDDYDCFWDYNQKYIRFKASTIPGAGTDNIEVTGIPLFNLVVQVEDPTSIVDYGVFEFAKTDTTLQSRGEAVSFARAELNAYKNGVIEGGFTTYESGLRSGQVINITSTLLDVSEDFLIQSVSFQMKTVESLFEYKVQLATLHTVGIIDFLIGLLQTGDRIIGETSDTVIEKTVFPYECMEIDDSVEINTDDYPQTESMEIADSLNVQALDFAVEFVIAPYTPDPTDPADLKRVFILDGSRLG